ncbi:MAG: tetratricopeptide repeat protein [Chitinispirillales bacterium]|jgi:tetratricopeptide (TPR) repeat protein|nr:tetratricopeptide repeat protein [Chitinispirillales bacterium]
MANKEALAHLDNGKKLLGDGKCDEAILELDRALAIDGKSADAHFYRGHAYVSKGDRDRVTAVDLPTADQSQVYDGRSDYDQAIADYTAALALNPATPEILCARGHAYRRKGAYDRAIEDYTVALSVKPDYRDALNSRGVVHYRMGAHKMAIKDWESILKIDPNDATAKQSIEIAR